MTSGNEPKQSKPAASSATGIRTYNVADYYEILDKVGRGTYGTVYKAKGLKDGKFYAIKKLQNNDTKLQQQGFPITALREISLLKQIDHANIIKLKEIIVSRPNKRNLFRGSTFLVFEYMDHDFAGLFKHKNKFALPETKAIMKQLLEGVAYLHRNKIMHRDIKSANILMNDDGCVKLADFGLGRKVRFENFFTYKVVTLWYRAPELLLGCKSYTDKIDVWSLGCVLVEFFTGEVLFRKQTEYAQMERIYEVVGDFQANDIIINDELLKIYQNYQDLRPRKTYPKEIANYLRKFQPSISDCAIDFVERMLHLDPAKRMTCEEALRHPFFTEKPLACSKNQIKKQDYECHEMFRDRALKIVRTATKKDDHDKSSHRPKQPYHKDSKDFKGEHNGDRESRKQNHYHKDHRSDDRTYRPKEIRQRRRDEHHYEHRRYEKTHSEAFSSDSNASRTYSSSSSDYSSPSRSPRSRSRHDHHHRPRDSRDERRYKDDYHRRQHQERKHISRRDQRRQQDKPYRQRRDSYHKLEHDQRKYRDYRDERKRLQGHDRRKDYRDDYELSRKQKRPERRQESIKHEESKLERKQERRSQKRDDRKQSKDYHGRDYHQPSRDRRIDKEYKGGSTYESKERKYHDDRQYKKERFDDKHEKHSKDRYGDEKHSKDRYADDKHHDYRRGRDEPVARDRYYGRDGRKKEINSGSSEHSPHYYKRESSRHQKSSHYQPKHSYKKQPQGGYEHRR